VHLRRIAAEQAAIDQHAGLMHLRRIAAEQAAMYTGEPLPYTGPATQSDLVALGRMEKIATGPLAAAVTAPFRIDDHTVMRLPRITVLIPAHNEAATIAQTIRSLRGQTLPVASITVVCDNCTDDTAAVAAAEGAHVMTTLEYCAEGWRAEPGSRARLAAPGERRLPAGDGRRLGALSRLAGDRRPRPRP
jgi:hypothetical protein